MQHYTDGQYRQPLKYEQPVYVKWNDGTIGWINKQFLQVVD